MDNKEKAVVTVVGKDRIGILAEVSAACAAANTSCIDVTQAVTDRYFNMVMVIDISNAGMKLADLQDRIRKAVPDVKVHVMHEDIFNSMHRI